MPDEITFSSFGLHEDIMKAINGLGFTTPTPVQQQAIPFGMQGKDIRACAQTGSGKTLAFVAPVLHSLLTQPPTSSPSVLIMIPTRELATQVDKVVTDIGKFTKVRCVSILGGANFARQVTLIKSGAQIVCATPGRLLDHLERRTFNLKGVTHLILDEADRMLDMGFLPDITRIMNQCPPKKQTMLFSATFPPEIQSLVSKMLHDPYSIDISPSVPSANVAQVIYPISRSQKEALLQMILANGSINSALIFCRTKHGSDHLVNVLKKWGKSVAVIHSDRTQTERYAALEGFRERKYQLLVATDIASRGIDIKDISHVINFDVPHHPEDYVHRIGRTGRAEANGDAFTLVSPDEEPYLKRIEKFINKTLPRGVMPDFPYLVPPKLSNKTNAMDIGWGRMRKRIATSRGARFK